METGAKVVPESASVLVKVDPHRDDNKPYWLQDDHHSFSFLLPLLAPPKRGICQLMAGRFNQYPGAWNYPDSDDEHYPHEDESDCSDKDTPKNFDQKEALICCYLMDAVYASFDEDKRKAFLSYLDTLFDGAPGSNGVSFPHDKVTLIEDKKTDTQVMVCLANVASANDPTKVEKSYVVVSFRGTESLADAITDLTFRYMEVPDPYRKDRVVRMHKGFHDCSQSVRERIEKCVSDLCADAPRKVLVTGHSLGAGCAVVFSFLTSLTIDKVYTFGQPRPGPKSFKTAWQAKQPGKLFRFINKNDIIARLGSRWLNKYRHVGYCLRLNEDGTATWNPDIHLTLKRLIQIGTPCKEDHCTAAYHNFIKQIPDLVKSGKLKVWKAEGVI